MTYNKSAASQWGIPSTAPGTSSATGTEHHDNNSADSTELLNTADKSYPDTMKRRAFFEAIRQTGSAQNILADLLKDLEQQKNERLEETESLVIEKINNLKSSIEECENIIREWNNRLTLLLQYNESDDEALKQLLQEKQKREEELIEIRQKITDVRIKLGEAKSGIVSHSLKEAESQINYALQIQHSLYDQSLALNQKKFNDEKDNLAKLSACYQQIYANYEKRYDKISKHLMVLDVDGVNPITSQVLTSIGTISFGAAGFFFSTFAGYAGFGNQDILYYILGGLIGTASHPMNVVFKVMSLLGLIALIMLVTYVCNRLLGKLKKTSEEEVLSEVTLSATIAKKIKQLEYNASIKSNNVYGFLLQLVPAIFIAGLIILCLAQTATGNSINAINSSSEGLIVGTSLAISLAGLIYLYIIKIVEPRLIKRYDAQHGQRISWLAGNLELVAIMIIFIGISCYVLLVPYRPQARSGIISIDERTRYAILLFITVCLLGGTSFAYGMRYRGLLAINRYLEKIMRWLNSLIAYCSAPETPDVHNKLSEKNGNIIQQVLDQLAARTVIDPNKPAVREKNRKEKNFFARLTALMKKSKQAEAPANPGPPHVMFVLEPWEERYFPHLVDEIKAIDFNYQEKKRKIEQIDADIAGLRMTKATDRRLCETEILQWRNQIIEHKKDIETQLKEKSERCQKIRNTYNKTINDVLDGFHLGLWYRENGMNSTNGHFTPSTPGQSTPNLS